MRLSIGQRLFCFVLLAIVGVVATAIVLMRQNVTRSVGEYALNIELDRLDELSRALAQRYARAGWAFLPADAAARRSWIAREMHRLDQVRNGSAGTLPVAPPAVLEPPALPAPPAPVQAPGAMAGVAVPPLPPLPPVPPAPGEPGAPGGRTSRAGSRCSMRLVRTWPASRLAPGRRRGGR